MFRNSASTGLVLVLFVAILATAFPLGAFAEDRTEDKADESFPGPSHYLRGGYQYGAVLQTNDFLKSNNDTGQPIDRFQSVRIEFGWQTDGSKDWHHVYNMPSFGIGLYGSDYFETEDLGDPTSLYGFFVWPLKRADRWTFNFEIAFGFTNNWNPYDPVNNPHNTSFGLGRSVHIEGGLSAEYRLARKWSLIAALTATHFSNGGTQRPNHGLNQMGPALYAKFDVDTPITPPVRREIEFTDRGWNLFVTGSAGKRNLDLTFTDPDDREEYLNRSYFIGNLTVGTARKFSNKFRYHFGLDLGYDETVGDLMILDGLNNGYNADPSTGDNFELGLVAGLEATAHKTDLIVHLGYKVLSKEVEGRLPKLYQRIGVRQFVYQNWFVGLNVRFHEIGSADNLEWNLGYKLDM